MNVCVVLTYLADQALIARRFSVAPLCYESAARGVAAGRGGPSDEQEDDEGGLDAAEEEEAHDSNLPDDDADWADEDAVCLHTSIDVSCGAGGLAVEKVETATGIDPVLWRAETERVSRLLDSASAIGSGCEWAQHLRQLKDYSDHTSTNVAVASVKQPRVARGTEDKVDHRLLAESMGAMRREIDQGLVRIRAAERVLVASGGVPGLVAEYSGTDEVGPADEFLSADYVVNTHLTVMTVSECVGVASCVS